jgi:hypothetical protein
MAMKQPLQIRFFGMEPSEELLLCIPPLRP